MHKTRYFKIKPFDYGIKLTFTNIVEQLHFFNNLPN